MSPLQIVLNDRAKQTKLREQAEESTECRRNPFGGGDSSDSDTDSEKPKVRQISSISSARPQSPPRKPSPPPLPKPAKSGPKGSQIARLVARRNDAAAGLSTESRDARDEALFRYDVDRCDEGASAAGYVKRPVEGFGELMLRSMGWRGSVDKGTTKDPTPRPARLGLGAKVEDLPSGLSGKIPRGRVKGAQEERTTNANGSQREASGRAEQEGNRNVSDEEKSDGITAESSENAQGMLGGTDGFAGDSNEVKGRGSTRGRRRKRSRFADDPGS